MIENSHERTLKKIQLWIALLAGVTTLVVGAYNIKHIFFAKKEAVQVEPVRSAEPRSSNSLRSAAEEVGASWLKEWGMPKQKENEP